MARAKRSCLPRNSIVKIPLPSGFSIAAAGIIIIYGTALHALEDRASLKPVEPLASASGLPAARLARHGDSAG